MRMTTLPLAAALLLSTVALAQAQGVPSAVEQSQAPATHGSGASNNMGNQPAGTVEGSGGTPSGISRGDNAGNRGMGTGSSMDAMHHAGMTTHHAMRHRMARRHRHRMMHHHMAAMNPTNGGANDTTHSDNGAMTGGNHAGRDDSNRGSAPNGGTNGVTPH